MPQHIRRQENNDQKGNYHAVAELSIRLLRGGIPTVVRVFSLPCDIIFKLHVEFLVFWSGNCSSDQAS